MGCNCGQVVAIGGGTPFTLTVSAGKGAHPIAALSGPISVPTGSDIRYYSINSLDIVSANGVDISYEIRLDPNPLNTLTLGPAGLLATGGGGPSVNIYNSDGTITSPLRTITIGASQMVWNATIPTSNTIITNDATLYDVITTNTATGDVQALAIDTTSAALSSVNAVADKIATITAVASGVPTNTFFVKDGANNTTLTQGSNYIDLAGPIAEIRLQGNPGNPGDVITSAGAGSSASWLPLANSLVTLIFPTDVNWDFGGNNWNVTNANNIAFTANNFTVNSANVCFPLIAQDNTITQILGQTAGGCLRWRDIASFPSGGGGVNIYNTDGTLTGVRTVNQNNQNITWNTGTAAFIIQGKLTVTGIIDPTGLEFSGNQLDTSMPNRTIYMTDGSSSGIPAGEVIFKNNAGVYKRIENVVGGSMNSFNLAGTSGPAQVISNGDTVSILGSGLISSVASATGNVTLGFNASGINNYVLQTVGGVVTWVDPTTIAPNITNATITGPVSWNFGGNNWTITNVGAWNVTATSISFNAPTICFPGITQDDSQGRFMVMTPAGCINWRDVGTLPGAGGGITSFTVAGNTGTNQTITNSNTLSILGSGLLSSAGSATDTVTMALVAGTNNYVIQTVAGVPTWVDPTTIAPNITNATITGATSWNFGGNNWTITGVNNWAVTANNITFNSANICFPLITQDDTVTKILGLTAGGCLNWRDVATISGSSLTAAQGTTIASNVIRLGSSAAGGASFTSNRFIDVATFGLDFNSTMATAPSGQSTVLLIQANYGGSIVSNAYDSQNTFPAVAEWSPMGFATWSSSGTMRRVDHNQMPYHNINVNANYTAVTSDSVIEVDSSAGPITITLPVGAGIYTGALASDGEGKIYTVKNMGTNAVTVVASGGGTIDTTGSFVLSNQYNAATFQATSSTNYIVIWDYEAGGGSGVTLADNGVSISGGTTAQLGTINSGTGVPLSANRFIEMQSREFAFTRNAGSSDVLRLNGANTNDNNAWSSSAYDLAAGTLQRKQSEKLTYFDVLGTMRKLDGVMRKQITNVSANYTVLTSDQHIVVSTAAGAVTLTLPDLSTNGAGNARNNDSGATNWGMYITINRQGANTLTIQGTGGQTIDNVASITINNNKGVSIQAISATDWVTVNQA